MNSFKSEPFLWIHLSGLAILPFFLLLVWVGLSMGNPFPWYWLELILLVTVGILPILWMQLFRPFDIFSILLFSIKPERLTLTQCQILTLFKSKWHCFLSVLVAGLMLWLLWFIYKWAPIAGLATSFLPQKRIAGLALASFAFLMSNLFLQVPVSVLAVLLTSKKKFAEIKPISSRLISREFILPGFKVNKIWLIPSVYSES